MWLETTCDVIREPACKCLRKEVPLLQLLDRRPVVTRAEVVEGMSHVYLAFAFATKEDLKLMRVFRDATVHNLCCAPQKLAHINDIPRRYTNAEFFMNFATQTFAKGFLLVNATARLPRARTLPYSSTPTTAPPWPPAR